MVRRKPVIDGAQRVPERTYHLLGMEDLFLDFAGIKPEQHPVRLALESLCAGQTVQLAQRNNHLELVNGQGVPVARLSRKAQKKWTDRQHEISEVRVVAVIRRYRDDVTEQGFLSRCHGERWAVPIVEMVL